jgi:hypothetical protein
MPSITAAERLIAAHYSGWSSRIGRWYRPAEASGGSRPIESCQVTLRIAAVETGVTGPGTGSGASHLGARRAGGMTCWYGYRVPALFF